MTGDIAPGLNIRKLIGYMIALSLTAVWCCSSTLSAVLVLQRGATDSAKVQPA